MVCGTVDLYPEGRRKIGLVLTIICLVQFLTGIAILWCGIYYLRNLEWRLSVILNHNTYTFGVVILLNGSLLVFTHICSAKIFYDSRKEETRHRFDFLLFPVLFTFILLMILESALVISCKVHQDTDLDHIRKGFLMSIDFYPVNSRIKINMDRVQSEEQCCGAEYFIEWLDREWVAPAFNPLSDPNMPFYEKSTYYPWNLFPPDSPDSSYASFNPYEPLRRAQTSEQDDSQVLDQLGKMDNGFEAGDTTTNKPVNMRRPRRRLPRAPRSARLKTAIENELAAKQPMLLSRTSGEGYAHERLPAVVNREHLSVVPWSCCAIDYLGPCIHDYVTQKDLVRDLGAKEYWNGESLSLRGCAPIIWEKYRSFSKISLFLFSVALIVQVALLILGRCLQTATENVDLYNREDGSAPGYLLPCSWFGGVDYKAIAEHPLKATRLFRSAELMDEKSEKDDTKVSLLDEYDNLKRKKMKKHDKFRRMLQPTEKIPSLLDSSAKIQENSDFNPKVRKFPYRMTQSKGGKRWQREKLKITPKVTIET